jgi:hypothetical protein
MIIEQCMKTKSPAPSPSGALLCFSTGLAIGSHEAALSTAKSQEVPDPFSSLSLLCPTSYNQVNWSMEEGFPPVLSFNVCAFVNKNNHL